MAEPGNPRRSKLDWLKSLRGADLTPAEVYVLVLLVSYSNAAMENAYPGVARLAADAGMSDRQVQRILHNLVAKGAIVVTQEGGNQVFRGAATVYKVLTPPQRKGDTHDTLQDDKPGYKGDISGQKGDILGQTRVTPMSTHQVINQVINHHPDSYESGPTATQLGACHGEDQDENDDEPNAEAFLEELNDELTLTPGEMTTAEAMWQRGIHPNAVRNKINKDRLQHFSGTFDANQDQEPRCKNCGVGRSRHAQWMAETGATHIFANTAT